MSAKVVPISQPLDTVDEAEIRQLGVIQDVAARFQCMASKFDTVRARKAAAIAARLDAGARLESGTNVFDPVTRRVKRREAG